MSSKGRIVSAFLVLTAMAVLGYTTWMNWQLQHSLAVLAETQERNLKEMMISLAHTEGQLGRVKEAVNAFDLQQWLATVQGPLVDRLEEKMSTAQRKVVGEEVKKWAQQISSEQTKRWQEVAKSIDEARDEWVRQTAAANQFGESLTTLIRNNEALSKQHHEGIQAQFMLLQELNKGIQDQFKGIEDQLKQVDKPAARVQAELEGIKRANQGLTELLEQRGAADQKFQAELQEGLELFAGAAAKQEVMTQGQIDKSEQRWQGLFLTLRENHEAELESHREVVSRLEQERVRALEQVKELEAQKQRERRRIVEQASEGRERRMGELIEFCGRRPESVLCRDLEIR